MKKECKQWFSIVVASMSVFNVLFFYAIHSMWSGVIGVLGTSSPYIIMALLFVIAVTSVIMLLAKKRNLILTIVCLALTLFFFVAEWYIFSVTYDSGKYFLREFFIGLGYTALIALFIFIVWYLPKTRLYNSKILKYALVFIFIFSIFFSLFEIIPNAFTNDPVVYAVEDEYQIVFSTRAKSTAWVVIDGVEYNDTYAGYRKSEDKVHKVVVPQEALDKAKSYTIYSRTMILRGPYSAFQGRTIDKTYNWRGINDDGKLNYYVISDTHNETVKPIQAGNYFGEDLDFLICCGDTASWIDTHEDASYALKLMGGITKGQIPVIYARGNHETKGLIADEYYKYVASKNQEFYYTFRLGNIWGIVLDIGEDHGDDWKEFYDAPKFDEYRAKQTEFLDSVIANKENEYLADGVDYRIAVCHIPLTFKYRSDHAGDYKDEWVERLNQMDLTMEYGGHRHQLMYIDSEIPAGTPLTYYSEYAGYNGSKPDGFMTDATFPSILVSRKSDIQQIYKEERYFGQCFIGLAVSSDGKNTTMKFTDDKHQVIQNIMSPWLQGVTYGNEIVVPNK